MEHHITLSALLMMSVGLLSVGHQGVRAGYNIGVGIADVTGPSAEVGFVSTPNCLLIFNVNYSVL
jgi:hypothetical protein